MTPSRSLHWATSADYRCKSLCLHVGPCRKIAEAPRRPKLCQLSLSAVRAACSPSCKPFWRPDAASAVRSGPHCGRAYEDGTVASLAVRSCEEAPRLFVRSLVGNCGRNAKVHSKSIPTAPSRALVRGCAPWACVWSGSRVTRRGAACRTPRRFFLTSLASLARWTLIIPQGFICESGWMMVGTSPALRRFWPRWLTKRAHRAVSNTSQ